MDLCYKNWIILIFSRLFIRLFVYQLSPSLYLTVLLSVALSGLFHFQLCGFLIWLCRHKGTRKTNRTCTANLLNMRIKGTENTPNRHLLIIVLTLCWWLMKPLPICQQMSIIDKWFTNELLLLHRQHCMLYTSCLFLVYFQRIILRMEIFTLKNTSTNK